MRPRPDEPHLLRFSVDTGPGIDSETQQRLFQPFQQGGSGTVQAVATGSGLGLVICSLLVKALGGTIEMKSEAGKGTHMDIHRSCAITCAACRRF